MTLDLDLPARDRGRVRPEERRARSGHHGAVLLLRGKDPVARAALGTALERALFDRGLSVALLGGDADLHPSLVETAHALARAGVVALLTAARAPGARMLRRGHGFLTVEDAEPARLREVLARALPLLTGEEGDFDQVVR